MLAGVPQGSILSPILYSMYTDDLSNYPSTTFHTFADDTCLLNPHEDPDQASSLLQDNLDSLEIWFHRWRVKINKAKSQHAFHLQPSSSTQLFYLNPKSLPSFEETLAEGLPPRVIVKWSASTERYQWVTISLAAPGIVLLLYILLVAKWFFRWKRRIKKFKKIPVNTYEF